MNYLVLAVLQGMSEALGARLLDRRDSASAIAIKELALSSAMAVQAARDSTTVVERCIEIFSTLIAQQRGFDLGYVADYAPVSSGTGPTPAMSIQPVRRDDAGMGFSLLELDLEIEKLRVRSAPDHVSATALGPPGERHIQPVGRATAFDLDDADDEITRLRNGGD